jgi:hypothetical protein
MPWRGPVPSTMPGERGPSWGWREFSGYGWRWTLWLSRRLSVATETDDITASVADLPTGAVARCTTTLRLRSPGSSRRRLIVAGRDTVGRAIRVSGRNARVGVAPNPRSAFPVAELELPVGSSWEGAELECELVCVPATGPAQTLLFVLPRDIPMPLGAMPRGPEGPLPGRQPRVTIRDPLPAGLAVLGLRDSVRATPARAVSFLEAVVAKADAVIPMASASASVGAILHATTRLLAGLSAAGRRRLTDLVPAPLEHLASLFAFRPRCDVLLVDPTEWPEHRGSAVCMVAPTWHLADDGGMPDFAIGLQLAGIWWEGGCRLVGRRAADLEVAVKLAATMSWLHTLGDPAQLRRARLAVERAAVGAVPHRWGTMRRSARVAARAARWALVLLEASTGDGAAWEVFREVLSHQWGSVLRPETIFSRLLDQGIRLA